MLTLKDIIEFYDSLDNMRIETDCKYLMKPIHVIIGVVSYILVVYILQYLMWNNVTREQKIKILKTSKFQKFLKYVSLVHNVVLHFFSLFCFIGLLYNAIKASLDPKIGFYGIFCDPGRKNCKGKLVFWGYLFYLSKYYEFIDTILIVLRGSRLRFIHVYHHLMTLIVVYFGLYFKGIGSFIAALLNTFVHIIMYFYYFLYTIGYHDLWWKNYLTDLQLAQFVIDGIAGIIFIFFNHFIAPKYGEQCLGDDIVLVECFLSFAIIVVVTYFLLFLRLKIKNKQKKNKIKKDKKEKKE